MSRRRLCAMLLVACCAMLASGCASDGSSSVHGSVYYGVGWHDPYYYGGGWYGGAVVVPDPPNRPDRPDTGPRPTPLPSSARPASRPSIPATPRPSGGGRRR
ncbi:MAG TPA: hypothetical protein VJT81_10470 [Burkholderiales bacterium]|nr:hypothetical protein [Burkholderiales bacterium]